MDSLYLPCRDLSRSQQLLHHGPYRAHHSHGRSHSLASLKPSRRLHWVIHRRSSAPSSHVVASTFKPEEPPSPPPQMSVLSAQSLLGVAQNASFEDILQAKNRLLAASRDDAQLSIQVEAAYDLLLMHSLMQRRAGKVADTSIRYADIRKANNRSSTSAGLRTPEWLRNALSKSPVALVVPSSSVIGTQTAVFTALIVWTYASGLSSSSTNSNADVPGFILAVGVGASIFSLRKQNVGFGKAAGITVAALTLGAVFGGVVESWLRVDLIPILGISSDGVFVSEFALLSLYLSSLFLC